MARRDQKSKAHSGRRGRSASGPHPGAARARRFRWPDAPARERIARYLGWVLVALTAAAIGYIAFAHHPIGDYFTESDFYGAYAPGARLLYQGTLDVARYGVYGPVYELALALVGLVTRDLFTAGRLIAVLSSAGTLALWFELLRRRAGAGVGFWCVLLLAANPVFFRYGYSATTDAFSVFVMSASLFALLGMRGDRAPLVSGLIAGIAILTRYNLAFLAPASVLALLLPGVAPDGARGRAIRAWLIACFAIVVPWTAFSLARGHVPGETLFSNYGFYAESAPARHVQDWTPAARDTATRVTFLELLRREGPGLLARWGTAAVDHLRRDLGTLIGWPLAALAAAGIMWAALGGAWRRHAPLALAWAFGFLALVPVFYSDRYSLAVLPFYAGAAALGVGAAPGRGSVRGAITVSAAALALWAAWGHARDSVALQRRVSRELPREVLETGKILRSLSPEGGRIVARKGHVGFYSGLDVVAFPRVDSLAALAAHAREAQADYLYFSWVEAQLRPEFSFFLDTTVTFPGLERVHVTERWPGVTYRIGPDFGTPPAWFGDDTLRTVHTLRGLTRVQPDSLVWQPRMFLGVYELMHGRPEAALRAADGILRARPREESGWLIRGEALYMLGRWDEARETYERLLSFDATNVAAAMGLGRVYVAAGRYQEAARIWRPLIDAAPAPEMLVEMAGLFEAIGDREAAERARGRLGR